jgi:hypothetical protein
MDTISGGLMPNAGSVKLTLDSNKVGYVVTPMGRLLKTTAGVINTTYSGKEGNILYVVPKTSSLVNLDGSSIKGSITYSGAKILNCDNCTLLTSIVALSTKTVYADNGSLTAKAIGDLLYNAYTLNQMACEYTFVGGSNALQGAVNSYLIATYGGLTFATVNTRLVTTNGGTLLIDTV